MCECVYAKRRKKLQSEDSLARSQSYVRMMWKVKVCKSDMLYIAHAMPWHHPYMRLYRPFPAAFSLASRIQLNEATILLSSRAAQMFWRTYMVYMVESALVRSRSVWVFPAVQSSLLLHLPRSKGSEPKWSRQRKTHTRRKKSVEAVENACELR